VKNAQAGIHLGLQHRRSPLTKAQGKRDEELVAFSYHNAGMDDRTKCELNEFVLLLQDIILPSTTNHASA